MVVPVGFALMVRVDMVMRTMLPGVFVVMSRTIRFMLMFVLVLVSMIVFVDVFVFMRVRGVVVGMLVVVLVLMFVVMGVSVLVIAFHLVVSFLSRTST